nr:carnosine N-methyltransferase isoform X2 [Ipomoea trifida]
MRRKQTVTPQFQNGTTVGPRQSCGVLPEEHVRGLGQKERDQCYKPILEELERLFPNRCKESPPTCLVPGAGLGRLALEISCLDNDQLRPVSIPDIHPASAGITEGFSMCGGDFVEVYSDPSQEGYWDAVVTCFFLDTAHNIVEYIEVWINLGPLLYHFADMYSLEDEMSIELSLEDVKKVALHYGFEFVVSSASASFV